MECLSSWDTCHHGFLADWESKNRNFGFRVIFFAPWTFIGRDLSYTSHEVGCFLYFQVNPRSFCCKLERKCREAETDEFGVNESLKADPILWALSYVCMYIRLVVLLEMAPGSFGIYVNIHMKLFKRARYYLARHHTFMSCSHLFPRPCYP